jgi:hypothetical protein
MLGANISAIRRFKIPTYFARTDASSTIGGGGYLSKQLNGPPIEASEVVIRWTKEELEIFRESEICINTLEYYTALYVIMAHGRTLKGNVIHMEVDNTAAVAWLRKCRTKGCPAADALARIFTLYCITSDITLMITHIPGTDNSFADLLSRDSSLQENLGYDGLNSPKEKNSGDGIAYENSSRKESCRKLLYLCVTRPGAMHLAELLTVLTEVQ